ncbi:heavy-metal-associated domain-containing protein [Oceaniglobus roseus]|uniref:heavy-metal-associated domain-containing protein n=1 Tax=Oceaniglobus roseus TaxID=1737570 RepID=UPI000C7F6024|nr:heavy-metal-associated domain-containing protein [Kandeliimicrobium roseum]
MIRLTVPDMTCNHCKASIEAAVEKVDPGAEVTVDLTSKDVTVEGTASADDILSAIRAKGFDARPAA